MSRLIDADVIYQWYKDSFDFKPNEVKFSMLDIRNNLENIPTADVLDMTGCVEKFSQENGGFSQGLVKDLISRQTALSTIEANQGTLNKRRVMKILEGLPSACNETKQQATVSSDCISRQDAIEAVCSAVMGLSDYPPTYAYEIAEEALEKLPSADVPDINVGDMIKRQDAKDAVDMALDIMDHVPQWVVDDLLNSLDKVPSASTELSTFSDKLWEIAYERGKAEGQAEAWELAIDAYYGTTKEQELFECLTFTQAKTEREELGKCEEKNNAGQIFVDLANHINRCINDAVKKTREGEQDE